MGPIEKMPGCGAIGIGINPVCRIMDPVACIVCKHRRQLHKGMKGWFPEGGFAIIGY